MVFKKAKFFTGLNDPKRFVKMVLRNSGNLKNRFAYLVAKSLVEVLCAEIFTNGLRIKKNKFHTLRKVESFVAAQNAKPFSRHFGLFVTISSS